MFMCENLRVVEGHSAGLSAQPHPPPFVPRCLCPCKTKSTNQRQNVQYSQHLNTRLWLTDKCGKPFAANFRCRQMLHKHLQYMCIYFVWNFTTCNRRMKVENHKLSSVSPMWVFLLVRFNRITGLPCFLFRYLGGASPPFCIRLWQGQINFGFYKDSGPINAIHTPSPWSDTIVNSACRDPPTDAVVVLLFYLFFVNLPMSSSRPSFSSYIWWHSIIIVLDVQIDFVALIQSVACC